MKTILKQKYGKNLYIYPQVIGVSFRQMVTPILLLLGFFLIYRSTIWAIITLGNSVSILMFFATIALIFVIINETSTYLCKSQLDWIEAYQSRSISTSALFLSLTLLGIW